MRPLHRWSNTYTPRRQRHHYLHTPTAVAPNWLFPYPIPQASPMSRNPYSPLSCPPPSSPLCQPACNNSPLGAALQPCRHALPSQAIPPPHVPRVCCTARVHQQRLEGAERRTAESGCASSLLLLRRLGATCSAPRRHGPLALEHGHHQDGRRPGRRRHLQPHWDSLRPLPCGRGSGAWLSHFTHPANLLYCTPVPINVFRMYHRAHSVRVSHQGLLAVLGHTAGGRFVFLLG